MTLEAFELQYVVHLVRPIGERARDLEQLRAGLADASAQSLFYHTLQCQLRDPACEEQPPDDFSGWVNGVVQDRETAERMSFAVQSRNSSAEELRAALLEVLESIPRATRTARHAPAEGEFLFLAGESVTVPSGMVVRDATELVDALAGADFSVCFYHLIEQAWLPDKGPRLGGWLAARGEERLARWLEESATSGLPIQAMRRKLMRRWRRSHLGRRLADAAATPDNVRREEERATVARLVRRITGPGEIP